MCAGLGIFRPWIPRGAGLYRAWGTFFPPPCSYANKLTLQVVSSVRTAETLSMREEQRRQYSPLPPCSQSSSMTLPPTRYLLLTIAPRMRSSHTNLYDAMPQDAPFIASASGRSTSILPYMGYWQGLMKVVSSLPLQTMLTGPKPSHANRNGKKESLFLTRSYRTFPSIRKHFR